MCLYTFYPYKCDHQASLREEREWHYFLTKPCTARPEEANIAGNVPITASTFHSPVQIVEAPNIPDLVHLN